MDSDKIWQECEKRIDISDCNGPLDVARVACIVTIDVIRKQRSEYTVEHRKNKMKDPEFRRMLYERHKKYRDKKKSLIT